MAKGPFWAGGNRLGWFVKLHKEPTFYPDSPEDVFVKWFDSRKFSQGETGAALAAEALATRLNSAMTEG